MITLIKPTLKAQNMSNQSEPEKTNKKKTILIAALIGFAAGVAFMLTAKFVNYAIM
jgi:uncharacterized protein involved in exopolysaccharide biosynthesis